jgi:hypothetical protein
MKKYIIIALGIVLSALLLGSYKLYTDLNKYKELYNRERQNVEAYVEHSALVDKELKEFQFTMDELRTSKDSIVNKLLDEVNKLKIKDKNVQYLQYNTSVINKVDTICLRDTIFRDPVNLDTIVGDEWYTMNLGLRYPSTIITEPTFKSEKYVVISTKKEYNKKPSKIFFIRWFQKKHTVVTVDMEEKNPYIDNKENRFIKVVK